MESILPDAWMAGAIALSVALMVLDWQYVAIDESAVIVPPSLRGSGEWERSARE